MMRPKAKVRDSLPSDSATPARQRGRGVGPSGSRRHLEARFAPLGPARADDGEAAPPRPARPAMLPPINVTLLLRSAGLVVVVAAVLLALRPVSKIVRTSAPAPDLARIRVISSAGDSSAAAPARPKRQARLPQVAETPAPAPARTAVAAPPPAAAATPPADRALAFAPEPAAPTNPALIATVHAVPVFAPDAAKVPAASAPSPLPAPRPMALAEPAAPAPAPAAAAPAPAAPQSNAGALVREARRLIAKGQLAEGRDLLKRAAAAGDSHAATILAKTYDPRVLKVWHVKGAAVDPAEARRWYEKAQELGSPAAKAALEGVH